MQGIKRRTFLAGLASLGACSNQITSVGPPAGPLSVPGHTVPNPARPQDTLLGFDGLGLADLVKSKQISNANLIDAANLRIDQLDPHLNAMTTVVPERAYSHAASTSIDSVFDGVPMVFKDLINVGGVPRTNGSRFTLNAVPNASVRYVRAAEQAGLTIIGMTNTPEFASIALTDNEAFGATRNPWSLEHSAGGSSGGSAAAVAAGYVPIAHGTDGGGSNRIPASCCGVFGMKASRHRQVSGEADGSHLFLRTHQSLSRTVRDSAALFAQTQPKCGASPYPPTGFIEKSERRPLRIALSYKSCLDQEPTGSVRDVIRDTARLCESLGHSIEEIENPTDGEPFFTALEGIMLAGMPGLLRQVERQSGDAAEESGLLTPALVAMGRYAEQLPDDAYQNGIRYFENLSAQMSDFFRKYDCWLSPVIPIEAPKIGYIAPSMAFDVAMPRNRELLSHTALANAIGAPAMSVPLYHSRITGLPIGSHFMAAPGADRTLYELAYELEAAAPWFNRWAPHSAAFAIS